MGPKGMAKQPFSLIPFPKSGIPAIQINGQVSRQNGRLSIQYFISGETQNVFLPQRSASPQRAGGLWAATCFEFFLARPVHPQYWEFNLSPSGDWNVYYMDAYRQKGFREEGSIQQLPFEVKHEPGSVTLNTDVDLLPMISDNDSIQVGVSCIVQSIDRHVSHWALVHPHAQPDFHLRESFIIEL